MTRLRRAAWLALPFLAGCFVFAACTSQEGFPLPTEGPEAATTRPAAPALPNPAVPTLENSPAPADTPDSLPDTPTATPGQAMTAGEDDATGLSSDSSEGANSHAIQQIIASRAAYDVSRPFAELIKPRFFARSGAGEPVAPEGDADLILEIDGKVKVRLRQGGREVYLDPLALESELLGEHPVHKIFRLQAMGVPVDSALAPRLQPAGFDDNLFHTAEFEYLQGRVISAVVAEVFPDGTLLVIPFETPPEWQGTEAAATANILDIAPGTRIRYSPAGDTTFDLALSPDRSLDPVMGPRLSLDDGGSGPPDDGFSRVELTAAFPFLGQEYRDIFVGSDGHITLGAGDGASATRDAARHAGGPPRVAALLTDLNPECGGSVHADARSDRVVVTWNRVVHIQRGVADGCGPDTPTNTMQAILYYDGTIDLIYGELDTELFAASGGNREAVIGVAGGIPEDPPPEGSPERIDITADLSSGPRQGVVYEEYRPKPSETAGGPVAAPTHFHVNARAMSVRDSSLARGYEEEILALPFEDQRYPPASLARKQCEVYQESLQDARYTRLLTSVGYQFTPNLPAGAGPDASRTFGEDLMSLLREGAGEGTRYFGFEPYWVAGILRELGVPWIGECDTAGSLRSYRQRDRDRDEFYLTVRRSLEPDKIQRYRVVKLDDGGGGREIYTAPGIMLMALPLPWDDGRWLISAEGWPAPEDGKPADPRWQSVYIVNVNNPEEYREVEYPISRYPNAPEEGLYGASASLSDDSDFLYNTLYGFTDEGGGLWVVDLTDEGFQSNPERFARIVEWDHMLSWLLLEEDTGGPSPSRSIFVTGKEVASDFAMTANFLRLKNTGIDSTLESKQRLLQMVGWNPVPFARQTLSEHKFRVAVETHFSYENSLLPRAKGVYIVPVDTTLSN